jgi:hypothetical protein
MFQILDYSCSNAAFCGSSSLAGYRTTPAMRDPYRYIRTGNYAKILSHEITYGGLTQDPKKEAAEKKAKQFDALGLAGHV